MGISIDNGSFRGVALSLGGRIVDVVISAMATDLYNASY